MLKRNHLFFLLVLTLALVSVLYQAPLASSQGLTITSVAVTGDLPIDAPDSALWQQATAVEVPLSAQMIARPILPTTNIKAVTVRSLHNAEELALLLEWSDETRNDSTLAMDEFRDSVAVQFPLVAGQPFFCMGQQGGDVNIWHWKADWQAALTAQEQMRARFPNAYVDPYAFIEPGEDALEAPYNDINYLPAQAVGNLMAPGVHHSSVEDLLAGGFGSLTSQPLEGQNVWGHGEWNEGVWRVIFSRSLTSAEQEDVTLGLDQVHSVAFAAWDGANRERNGMKSTSQWVSLQFGAPALEAAPAAAESAPSPPPAAAPLRLPGWLWLIMVAAVVLVLLGVYIYRKL